MQTLEHPSKSTFAPGAEAINQAFHDAQDSCLDANFKAVKCGNLLNEQRSAMTSSHREKSLVWHDGTKEESDKFTSWLKSHCRDIPQSTAYRWMQVSFKLTIHLGLVGSPLSKFLNDPESEQHQSLLTFMAGKTMRGAIAAAIVEGDDSQRALNGATKGGTRGENRKDYPLFVSKHLIKINTNLENWDKLAEEKPAIVQEMAEAMRRAIMGGPLRIDRSGATENVNGWPDGFCKLVKDLINERLRQNK